MKYTDRQLLDRLAAQYVVGTLRGRARSRFERICVGNEYAMAAVKRWEDRFVGMLAQVKPVQPPQQVWSAIEQRLGLADTASQGFVAKLFGFIGTRAGAGVFAALAVVTIAVGMLVQQSLRLEPVAVIAQEARGELWRVQASRNAKALVVEATASVTVDATHSYELWALPSSGAAPVSLGLLPTRGSAKLTLTEAQRLALSGSAKVAVSLEPVGGSPTGAPTGPVLHVADVTKSS